MLWRTASQISFRWQPNLLHSLLSIVPLFGVICLFTSYANATANVSLLETLEQSEHNTFIVPAIAQNNQPADRNQERFLQPSPIPLPIAPESETPVQQIPPARSSTTVSAPDAITVQTIQVTESTVFGDAELNPIIQLVEGQTVTLERLKQISDQITQLYLEQGYITSRAILVQETLSTGIIEIRVIEGQLEAIEIEGTQRINPNYIRKRIRLGGYAPLNTGNLENQLRLLRGDPLFENIEASLKSGSGLGQSILVVRVTEANPFDGNLSIDNYSPPSVGSERLGIDLTHRNLTGIGDQISASYDHTTASGSDTLNFSYRVPVNAMDGTVQARASFNWNRVILEDFRVLDIRGQSEFYEISYRQPFIRTPKEELALSFGFTFQDGLTFLGDNPFGFSIGTDDGVSRTSVFKFGQDYVKRDVAGAWAFRSLLNFGTGLFDATVNDSPTPDGLFFSWLLQAQRVQVLNPDNFLIIQADLQLTPHGLLPSQQFVIGGGQSLRGYRQNVRAGDNGVRFSVEDRITLDRDEGGTAVFQVAPFIDMGAVWNVDDNPNVLADQTFLLGVGLGILWQPIPKLNIRLDYGIPLVDIDDRGENAQDDGFYFNVNYDL